MIRITAQRVEQKICWAAERAPPTRQFREKWKRGERGIAKMKSKRRTR